MEQQFCPNSRVEDCGSHLSLTENKTVQKGQMNKSFENTFAMSSLSLRAGNTKQRKFPNNWSFFKLEYILSNNICYEQWNKETYQVLKICNYCVQ